MNIIHQSKGIDGNLDAEKKKHFEKVKYASLIEDIDRRLYIANKYKLTEVIIEVNKRL